MKKLISVLLCVAILVPSISIMLASVGAEEVSSITVSNSAELISAIADAEESSVIYLKGGRYVFDSTFNIENVKKNITLCSVKGETAVFTTADKVENWQECTINGVSALCASANGKTVTALFANGTQLQRARLPESGFWYIDKVDLSDTVGSGDAMGTNGIYVHDIEYEFKNPEDICVSTVHWWVNELSPMTSFDASTGLIKVEKYSGMSNQDGDRYFLENVKESVDKAGEWCFDSSEDKIYYVPQDGENADNLCLYASSEAEMMKINNCSGITFKNIEFAETAFTYGDEKYINTDIHTFDHTWKAASFQAAVEACGAVTVTYSDNINFENCEFRNIGCTALKYFNGAKHCKVENCIFERLGASAVFAGGKFNFHSSEPNDPNDYAEDITVTNCEVFNYGLKFFGACGITVAYCDTADISHNEIHDGYYTGISVGYCWLFFDNPTENISVKDNLIYDIGLNMISDLAGIYLLGVQEGTVVSGNVIHDVTCYDGESGYAGNGIYLDSGCEFMTIEKNLVFNCDTTAYNTTLSKNNTLRNNIFSFSGQSIASLGLSSFSSLTGLNSSYYNNIFLTDGGIPVIEYLRDENHFCGSNNIIWDNTNGDEVYFCEEDYGNGKMLRQTAENKGYVESAVFEDPGFTDASNYDFTFKDDSYAISHGFEPIDYDNAGTLNGTTIGFDVDGGQTPYNSNTKETQKTETKLNFIEKIKQFFYKIGEFFKNMNAKIKGVTEKAKGTELYQAFFEKRSGNESTEKLEQLFNKVKEHVPTYRVDETRKPYKDDDRISAIYFDGEDCMGKDTEIFAYYGIPEGASTGNPVPAVVLVHGGGQHAQADWVKYWVDNGYAAIAIDGFGQEPCEGEYVFDVTKWSVNPDSHITYTGHDDIDKDLTEQWFYYYITDIILANNILRNDSRIVHNEIGVVGISWGGMATSVAIGYDERFAFAIPIYGCPYASDSSSDISSIFYGNSAEVWEASLRLDKVKMPVLLVNGNDDPFFSPQCATTSAAYLKNGNVTFLNGISHGKFNIEETIRFANEITGRGNGNIHITGLDVNDNKANISFTLPDDAGKATVTLYVRDNEFEYENLKLKDGWKTVKCTCSGNNARVTIPDGIKYYYFEVTANSGEIFNKTKITASTGVFSAD